MIRPFSISLRLVTLIMVFAVVVSCDKDDEDEPTTGPAISLIDGEGLISSDAVLKSGEEINLSVNLQMGDLNITNFLIEVMIDGSASTYFDTGMNTASFVWNGTFFKTLAQAEEWNLVVTDREGNTASTGFTITLDTTASYLPLFSYDNIVLGAQDNAASGGCLNPYDQNIYFVGDAAADTILQDGIEMIYYYYGDDKNVIGSPGANIEAEVFPENHPSEWTKINTTRYIETSLSVDDFNNATNDSIILANYNEGDAKRKAKKLQANEVFTFRTQKGKLGMFLVNEVTGTTEGTVSINIKIQE